MINLERRTPRKRVLVCILLTLLGLGATTQHITPVQQLRSDTQKAYKEHNFPKLAAVLTTLESEWPGDDLDYSSALLLEICNTLSRGDYTAPERFDVIHQASIKGLAEGDLPFNVRAQLAANLSGLTRRKEAALSVSANPEEISEDAVALVDVWNALAK